MRRTIETEYKVLLDKESFYRLRSVCDKRFHESNDRLQVNYYFDTADNAFYKRRETIRIRQTEAGLKLQYKKHAAGPDVLAVSEEYSAAVPALTTCLKLPGHQEPVFFKGALVTARRNYGFGKSGILSLDYNMYAGISDYEAEFEMGKSEICLADELIQDFGLSPARTPSKSARFFKRLEEMQGGSGNPIRRQDE